MKTHRLFVPEFIAPFFLGLLVGCGVEGDPNAMAEAVDGASADSELRGGGTSPATVTLDQADPHLGDSVTFTVTGISRASINIACYDPAGGVGSIIWTVVQDMRTTFLLGGTDSLWKSMGGPADCYAWLYKNRSAGFIAVATFKAQGAR